MIATHTLLTTLMASATPQPSVPDRTEPAQLAGAEGGHPTRGEGVGGFDRHRRGDVSGALHRTRVRRSLPGEVLPRAALIAGARKRRPGAAAVALGAFRVHLTSSTAIAESSELWSTSPGKRSRIVWSDLWVQCGGKWCLLTSTAAGLSVPASDPPPPGKGQPLAPLASGVPGRHRMA